MTKQEQESMLYNEFDKFASEPGESIHSYYLRYAKLINDIKMIPMSMSNMQINMKFVNHLQVEWSRFVTAAKQNQASGARVVNPVGNAGENQPRKRVKDSEWFKDKMLLAQAQETGVVLNDEQQDFLADTLEETDDCEDLQLQVSSNFKEDRVDAYDSDCDDEATTNAIFMVNLSPVGSINDDTVEPRYDFDILSKVPHYDTYHDYNMINSNIQELGYIEC
ncbi:hypothetical protein Tco_1451054 [Tanacetum coccineum]